jgi:hypothetical protein
MCEHTPNIATMAMVNWQHTTELQNVQRRLPLPNNIIYGTGAINHPDRH